MRTKPSWSSFEPPAAGFNCSVETLSCTVAGSGSGTGLVGAKKFANLEGFGLDAPAFEVNTILPSSFCSFAPVDPSKPNNGTWGCSFSFGACSCSRTELEASGFSSGFVGFSAEPDFTAFICAFHFLKSSWVMAGSADSGEVFSFIHDGSCSTRLDLDESFLCSVMSRLRLELQS